MSKMICLRWKTCNNSNKKTCPNRVPHKRNETCDKNTPSCPKCIPAADEDEDALLGASNV